MKLHHPAWPTGWQYPLPPSWRALSPRRGCAHETLVCQVHCLHLVQEYLGSWMCCSVDTCVCVCVEEGRKQTALDTRGKFIMSIAYVSDSAEYYHLDSFMLYHGTCMCIYRSVPHICPPLTYKPPLHFQSKFLHRCFYLANRPPQQ